MKRSLRPLSFALLLLALLAGCTRADPAESGGDEPGTDLAFVSDPDVTLSGDTDLTVQILHASDQEAGVAAIEDAPRFSAVINGLRPEFDTTLTVASGDLYIPGPFFNTTGGRADIRIANAVGTQAAVFGNHEFDLGTGAIAELLTADEPDPEDPYAELYYGTRFPYLSANLDFSQSDLAGFVVPDGQEADSIPNSIAKSAVITASGETFGIVGVTTPLLPQISSPGAVQVLPSDPADLEALAAQVQPVVDALTAEGIDKVILLAHLQQLQNEIDLAGSLEDVDVIVAGGSDTLLAADDDRLREGDERLGAYPLLYPSASGDPIAVVNTSREYRYVGRLVVGFDETGILSEVGNESGAYATDAEGVEATGGADPEPSVVDAVEEVEAVITELDGQIFGATEVFLNGQREDVRTQETNLGNLTADANLVAAREEDPAVAVSIKNGGGIRTSIGAFELDGTPVPPPANPLTGKEAGEVSLLDVQNALRFNNSLSVLTLSAEELKRVVEHGVAATAPGATPGQFPQVGGVAFSFDPSAPPLERSEDGTVIAEGARVQSLVVLNDDGSVADTVVAEGAIMGDPSRSFRVVTLGFLADGGDGYPFPATGRVDLKVAEQEALQSYLPEISPFTQVDTPPEDDERIQNLSLREDTLTPAAVR